MEHIYPPALLVKTWLEIIEDENCQEAQLNAMQNINFHFDSFEQAATYIDHDKHDPNETGY